MAVTSLGYQFRIAGNSAIVKPAAKNGEAE
jgi:hypothetical protein